MPQSPQNHHQKYTTRLALLNPAQRRAVDTIEGPVLVIAGPGSGKTELLSLRVANILKNTDTLASSILCLTFTDSAAVNMRKRLAGLIGPDAYKVAIHTFHSFGAEIINQNPEFFYEGALYNPADQLTQYEILGDIFENLDHTCQLNSYHPEQGYTYIKDTLNRIGELKKSGLSPEEFLSIIKENKNFLTRANKNISDFFSDRISKKAIDTIQTLISDLQEHVIESAPPSQQRPSSSPSNHKSIAEQIIGTLKKAQADAEEQDSTKPITAWKAKYTKKNKKKETVLKDFEHVQKHEELAKIYAAYQSALHQKGFFDFDDMLLDTVQSLETYPELKYNVQEKYLYVLVDEFQDTSGVQTRLLDNILDTEINNGRPNILAVGDDDQAIFKFQGANISNIMGFHKKYNSPEIIVLSKNYRSTQPILDIVRNVVLKGEDRLENLLPEITKNLEAANPNIKAGDIIAKQFETVLHEYMWLADEIKKKIDAGLPPNEIAVIAPKHRILEQAAKVLDHYKIPVAYERKKDIFEQKHIAQIIKILAFIYSLNNRGQKEADELLPEILSFDFWQIERLKIWRISTKSYKQRKHWLEVMLEDEDEYINEIANFLINLGAMAKEITVEEIIDYVTGVNALKKSLEVEQPTLFEESLEKPIPEETAEPIIETDPDTEADAIKNPQKYFRSPYKSFYFSDHKFQNARAEYLDFLSCLSAFIDAVREYKGSETLTAGDLLEFEKLHETHKIKLTYLNSFNNDEKAVNLLTAHKAKGLEFDTVFVINCQEEIWIKGGYRSKLSFPSNLPLSPEAENIDDKLRLFYVALSRAKSHLYITNHKFTDNAKEQVKLRFLEGVVDSEAHEDKSSPATSDQNNHKELTDLLELKHTINKMPLPTADEEELLRNMVKDYKLSVTHLNNFLNIIDGGPAKFLEQNLLRFPHKQNLSAAFGSAMHNALHIFQNEFRRLKNLPNLDFLLEQFTRSLGKQRLNKNDYKKKLKEGHDHLSTYFSARKEHFDPGDQPEVGFKNQGSTIGSAEITGNIDKIKYLTKEKELYVYDYKTGKPLEDWGKGSGYDEIKAWAYKNQLIFYKILVENARDFRGKYTVNKGYLEFLKPDKDQIKILDLQITNEDTEKLKKVIQSVYNKIINLDFPDVSGYEPTMHGIESFICDLIDA